MFIFFVVKTNKLWIRSDLDYKVIMSEEKKPEGADNEEESSSEEVEEPKVTQLPPV